MLRQKAYCVSRRGRREFPTFVVLGAFEAFATATALRTKFRETIDVKTIDGDHVSTFELLLLMEFRPILVRLPAME